VTALDFSTFVGRAYAGPNSCWSLVREVYAEAFGRALPAYDADAAGLSRAALAALIDSQRAGWAEVEAEQAGDVVLFRILGAACHVGVVQAPGLFLHVLLPGDTARIESYRGPTWRPRIEGFYRAV
jgi:cell wall-associated NlpC family hydrolase